MKKLILIFAILLCTSPSWGAMSANTGASAPSEAYDDTGWDNDGSAAQKNDIRDILHNYDSDGDGTLDGDSSSMSGYSTGAVPNTDGGICDGCINYDDLDNTVKFVEQDVTSDADPYTLTPTAGYHEVRVDFTGHADNVTITLSETGATDGEIVIIKNVASNTLDMADSSAVQELSSPWTGEQNESITFQYQDDRFVEIARSSSTLAVSSYTTTETEFIPIAYAIDGATAPAAIATKTSGTDKVNTRDFDGAVQDEDVIIPWKVPLDLDTTNGIKFRVTCLIVSATAPSSETWQFELQGFSLGDGDALDGTLGTAQTSNSGSRSDAQYDVVHTAWSSAMTSTHITDLAIGETVIFKLYRDIDDTDTYAQDIGVIGLELKYQRLHNATF